VATALRLREAVDHEPLFLGSREDLRARDKDLAGRRTSAEDLYKPKLWRESEPEAPDVPWYKDVGSFKICGEGELPRRPPICHKPLAISHLP
jgi:hypothetical protein